MASRCYFCNSSYPHYYPGRSSGYPVGSCDYCGLFCCDFHAYFDPNIPAWTCALCDTNNLVAHAIFRQGGPKLSVALTTLVSSALVRQFAIYESFDAFLQQSPLAIELADEFATVYALLPGRLTNEHTRNLWEYLDEDGRRMISAAVAITLRYEIPDDRLAELLRVIVSEFRQAGQ